MIQSCMDFNFMNVFHKLIMGSFWCFTWMCIFYINLKTIEGVPLFRSMFQKFHTSFKMMVVSLFVDLNV
jgi:hypothetical protein